MSIVLSLSIGQEIGELGRCGSSGLLVEQIERGTQIHLMAADLSLAGIDDQTEVEIAELAKLGIIIHNHLVNLKGIDSSPSPLVSFFFDSARFEVNKRAVGVFNAQELVSFNEGLVPLDSGLDDSIRSNRGNLGIESVVNDSTWNHLIGDIAVIRIVGEHIVFEFSVLGSNLRHFVKGIERAVHITLSGPCQITVLFLYTTIEQIGIL